MNPPSRKIDWRNPLRWPLTIRVLVAVIGGLALGLILREMSNQDLAAEIARDLELLGKLVVQLLVMLATPLIFFAILDAFASTHLSGRQGFKLLLCCAVNVTCACALGLAIINVMRPGDTWKDHLPDMIETTKSKYSERPREPLATLLIEKEVITDSQLREAEDKRHTLSPLKFVEKNLPTSFLKPFLENTVLQVVLLALLAGMALRHVRSQPDESTSVASETVVRFVNVVYHVLLRMLTYIVQLVPLAVFGMLSSVVSKFGLEVFGTLWIFLVTILAGMALHSLGYYSLAVWLWGRRPPWILLQRGGDAILTGLFTNSSLATVPITLRALTQRMGVSDSSARLSACVGTNFNNDGITLYEAMAALFLAQAMGQNLTLSQQIGVLLSAVMAGISITGIPEAGIIVLPLVLSAAGMDAHTVAASLVLLLPVDVIIARVRSAVNVMGDMTVAIMLDGPRRAEDDSSRT